MNDNIRIRSPRLQRGFSLVEVLVALIIIGVGMLGLAKLQGLAYASTANSSERSLAALNVSSLIAAMRANRSYWTNLPTQLNVGLAGATITSNSTLTTGYECRLVNASGTTPTVSNAPCTALQLAGYDLQTWANNVSTLLPNVTGSIQCSPVTGTTPVGCWVQLNWTERTASINKQSVTTTSTLMAPPKYTLYVVP